MEELLKKLNNYASLAEEQITQMVPEVWETTLNIIQIQGIMWTTFGVLLILFLIGFWWKIFPRLWERTEEDDTQFDWLIVSVFGSMMIFGVVVDVWLFDIDTWLSLINPKAAFLYRIGSNMGIF